MKRLSVALAVVGIVLSSIPAAPADAATCLGNSGQQVTGSGSRHKDSAACK
jgi:hypothetical protein